MGATLKDAPRLALTRGIVQRQKFLNSKFDIISLHEEGQLNLGLSKDAFTVPSFSSQTLSHAQDDLDRLFESQLEQLEQSDAIHEYLNAMSHYPEIRANLGFPE